MINLLYVSECRHFSWRQTNNGFFDFDRGKLGTLVSPRPPSPSRYHSSDAVAVDTEAVLQRTKYWSLLELTQKRSSTSRDLKGRRSWNYPSKCFRYRGTLGSVTMSMKSRRRVLGLSLLRLLVGSHRRLILLLCTALALRCAHLLTHSLRCSWKRGFCLRN